MDTDGYIVTGTFIVDIIKTALFCLIKSMLQPVLMILFCHFQGCFATLLDFIYRHLDTLIGLGLAIGFLQVSGTFSLGINFINYANLKD